MTMKFSDWTKKSENHVIDSAAGDHYEGLPATSKEAIDAAVDRYVEYKKKSAIQPYDSRMDTLQHIKRVNELLSQAASELLRRAAIHDNSKLNSPEKEFFDEFTPKLASSTYGSDEYKEFLRLLKPGLDHHYANNSHHPEHYENGVNGFDLFDLIEMFFDWKAAGERHNNGNIFKSIEINQKRFGISDQLTQIMINTAERLNYERQK